MMEPDLHSIDRKLDEILKNQRVVIAKEEELLEEEKRIETVELSILAKESKLMEEEEGIRKSLMHKVLKTLTLHDINKGIMGAFMGTIGHFAFFYGKDIAEQITVGRATLLYFFAYLTGTLMIYFSGFRKVKVERFLHVIPIRVTALYIISILASVIILFMFNQITFATGAAEIYKIVANVSVLAMFGAATADFLGD